ncbi:unnamed protein product [Protopolystoma xenopodis]|uniref:Uncharacterized protein n=1 Tax=Protopolystoma xenopodis TaxID=117903 RepID=A0A3S5B8W1_9PLAT|nr:unnamed protein product [Protopolystoma xenopodis]
MLDPTYSSLISYTAVMTANPLCWLGRLQSSVLVRSFDFICPMVRANFPLIYFYVLGVFSKFCLLANVLLQALLQNDRLGALLSGEIACVLLKDCEIALREKRILGLEPNEIGQPKKYEPDLGSHEADPDGRPDSDLPIGRENPHSSCGVEYKQLRNCDKARVGSDIRVRSR